MPEGQRIHRVYIRPSDGHVMLMGSTPERVEADHATTLGGMPELRDWAYVDVADAELPPRSVGCDDCGDEHPSRNQWRVVDGALIHDTSLRNPHAEIHHLEHAEAHELTKAAPSGARLAEIRALHAQVARATDPRRGRDLPHAEHVERVTAPALMACKQKRG